MKVLRHLQKRYKVRFNISGTSISAINGAIDARSKSDNPIKDLEDFWMAIKTKPLTIGYSILKLLIDNIFKYDLFL